MAGVSRLLQALESQVVFINTFLTNISANFDVLLQHQGYHKA